MTAELTGLRDLSNEDYHADPSSLSVSGAKKLLPPYCPARYKWERDNPVRKDVFDLGAAAHKMVLGDEAARLVVVEADDWRSKAARDQRDEARATGATPVLTADYARVVAMAEAIRAHPIASLLLNPDHGKPEQSVFWTDEETGVTRRARFDWLPEPRAGQLIVPDYKTAASANPEAFARAAASFGYHMQDAWYLDAIAALNLHDDPAFVFIVQEKEPPYLVTVVELDAAARQIGRNLNRRALGIYADCARTDTWPGYTTEIVPVSLPYYYERQHAAEMSY